MNLKICFNNKISVYRTKLFDECNFFTIKKYKQENYYLSNFLIIFYLFYYINFNYFASNFKNMKKIILNDLIEYNI